MMPCEAVEVELSAYLDGELSAEERVGLEAHLRTCQACKSTLADLELVKTTLAAIPKVKAPAGLAANIHREVACEKPIARIQPIHAARRKMLWGPAAVGLAAMLMLSLLAFLVLPALVDRAKEGTVALKEARPEPSPAPELAPAAPSASTPAKTAPLPIDRNMETDKTLEAPGNAPFAEAKESAKSANFGSRKESADELTLKDGAIVEKKSQEKVLRALPADNEEKPALPAPIVVETKPNDNAKLDDGNAISGRRMREARDGLAGQLQAQPTERLAKTKGEAADTLAESKPTASHLGAPGQAPVAKQEPARGAMAGKATSEEQIADAKPAPAPVGGKGGGAGPGEGVSRTRTELAAAKPAAPASPAMPAPLAGDPGARREIANNKNALEQNEGGLRESLARKAKASAPAPADAASATLAPAAPPPPAAAAAAAPQPKIIARAGEQPDADERAGADKGGYKRQQSIAAAPLKIVFRTRDPNALIAQLKSVAEANHATFESSAMNNRLIAGANGADAAQKEAAAVVPQERTRARAEPLAFAVIGGNAQRDALMQALQNLQDQPIEKARTVAPAEDRIDALKDSKKADRKAASAGEQNLFDEDAEKQTAPKPPAEARKKIAPSGGAAPDNAGTAGIAGETRIEIQIEVLP